MIARMCAVAESAKIHVAPSVTQRFCRGCSQIYVPGSNCHVRTERVKRRRRRRGTPTATSSAKKEVSRADDLPAAKKAQKSASARSRRGRFMCYSCTVCGRQQRFSLPARPRQIARRPCAGDAATATQPLTGKEANRKRLATEARNAAMAVKRARAAAKGVPAKGHAKGSGGPAAKGDVEKAPSPLTTSAPQASASASAPHAASEVGAAQKKRRKGDKMGAALDAAARTSQQTGTSSIERLLDF